MNTTKETALTNKEYIGENYGYQPTLNNVDLKWSETDSDHKDGIEILMDLTDLLSTDTKELFENWIDDIGGISFDSFKNRVDNIKAVFRGKFDLFQFAFSGAKGYIKMDKPDGLVIGTFQLFYIQDETIQQLENYGYKLTRENGLLYVRLV